MTPHFKAQRIRLIEEMCTICTSHKGDELSDYPYHRGQPGGRDIVEENLTDKIEAQKIPVFFFYSKRHTPLLLKTLFLSKSLHKELETIVGLYLIAGTGA